MKKNNLSVGFRLRLLAFVLLGLLIITNILGFFGLSTVTDALTRSYEERTVPMVAMGKAIDEINKAKGNLFLAMDAQYQADTDRYLKEMKEAEKAVQSNMDIQAKSLRTAQELALGEDFDKSQAAYLKARKAIITSFVDDADRPTAMVLYRNDYSVAINGMVKSINALFKYQDNRAAGEFRAARREAQQIKTINTTVTVLGFIIATLLSIWIIRGIVTPLTRAIGIAEKISKGNLTNSIEEQDASNDETVRLMQALRGMQNSLQSVIYGIRDNARILSSATASLSLAFNDVAQGSSQQSDAAQAIAASVEEMTVSFDQVNDNTKSALAKADNTVTVSQKGQTEVNQAELDIDRIVDAVKSASQSIESLGRYSQEINGIAAVIKEIADQTNLLALNAAIEAARAGEEGRGFAVVADEVRKLAEKTTHATGSIQAVLKTVQTETGRAADAMVVSTRQAAAGSKAVHQLIPTFNEIINGANVSRNDLTDLASSTREQALTSTSIAKSVEMIAGMAERNNVGVSSTLKTVDELKQISAELQAAVNQFEL